MKLEILPARPGTTRGPTTIAAVVARGRGLGLPIAVVAVAALTLFVVETQSSYVVFVYNSVLLACIGAIGFNVLMGTAGQVSMAPAAFLAIGAFGHVSFSRLGLPVALSLGLTLVAAAVVGAVFVLPALRLHGLGLALSTLAAHFIVLHVVREYQLAEGGSAGFTVPTLFSGRGLGYANRSWAWLLTVVVAVTIVVTVLLTRGRTGRALRVVRDHQLAAPLMGVHVGRYKLLASVYSSVLLALQGCLSVLYSGSVAYENYSLAVSIQIIAMVLIGGLDSVVGAIVGATVVTLLPNVVPEIVGVVVPAHLTPTYGPQIAKFLYGLLIVLIVVGARQGIVGSVRTGWRALWARLAPGAGPAPAPGTVDPAEPADRGDAAPVVVSRTATIAADAQAVWRTVADFGAIHTYFPSVTRCVVDGEGVGARRHLQHHTGGRTTSELTVLDHDSMVMEYRVIESTVPIEDYRSRIAVARTDEGCRVTYTSWFRPAGPASRDEVAAFLSAELDSALEGLRRLHEHRGNG